MTHKVNVRLGDSQRIFASKTELLAECKMMLARYRNGENTNDPDAEFLRGLLERHPEALQKIGCGVKRFFRDRTDQGTDCFWIVTTFIAANKIEVRPEMLSTPRDEQFATTFVDKELEQKFGGYHKSVAKLRIIRAKANLSLGGSERITEPKRRVILS